MQDLKVQYIFSLVKSRDVIISLLILYNILFSKPLTLVMRIVINIIK